MILLTSFGGYIVKWGIFKEHKMSSYILILNYLRLYLYIFYIQLIHNAYMHFCWLNNFYYIHFCSFILNIKYSDILVLILWLPYSFIFCRSVYFWNLLFYLIFSFLSAVMFVLSLQFFFLAAISIYALLARFFVNVEYRLS